MVELLIKIAINGAALLAAVKVVPDIHFRFGNDWWKVAVVAFIFGLVNSYLKPIVKLLALPISFLTMGLVGIVINAAMLLVTAWASGQLTDLKLGFSVGGYPPDLGVSAVGAAILGAIVVSVVATVLSLVLGQRRILGIRV